MNKTSDNPAMKRLADQLRRHPERLFRYDTDLRAMYDRVDEKTVLIQVIAMLNIR